jgi:regulator of protease activity HflC (stomatin/prohibitin superfamily)
VNNGRFKDAKRQIPQSGTGGGASFRLHFNFSKFESASSHSGSSPERSCVLADSKPGRQRRKALHPPLETVGSTPTSGPEQTGWRECAARKRPARIAPLKFSRRWKAVGCSGLQFENLERRKCMEFKVVIVLIGAVFAAIFIGVFLKEYRRPFLVPEGYAGLVYHKGKFIEVLRTGRHIRWGRHYTLDAQDVRKASLSVPGQDVLTADNVALKTSLLVTYQVVDPVKAAHETQNWQGDLYNAVQLALRAVAGGVAVEALLGQRLNLGAQLLALVQPEAAKVGVSVHAVEVKDVMFPADLKRAFADVLKAKQEGHAALERARGESAALRNLANAARVLEGNPALMNLRLMQSLATAQNAGSTLVLGMPGGFVPLKNGKTTPTSTMQTGGTET